VKNDELCRILGAYITADNNPKHLCEKLCKETNDIINTLRQKRARKIVSNAVIQQAIYPKIAYPLKFSNLTDSQIQQVFQPINRYIKKTNYIQDFPDVVNFGKTSSPYLMHFQTLNDYTNVIKYGIMNRLLDWDLQFKYVITSLIARAMKQRRTWIYTSPNEWLRCNTENEWNEENEVQAENSLEHFTPRVNTNTWGTTLIEFIQDGDLNINLMTNHYATNQQITQTLIHDEYDEELDYSIKDNQDDRFTKQDLIFTLKQYNLKYIEELFEARLDENQLDENNEICPTTYHIEAYNQLDNMCLSLKYLYVFIFIYLIF
jgi:hypothetical protein